MSSHQREYWLNFAENCQKDILCKDLHKSWDEQKQDYTEHTEIPEECLEVLRSNTGMELVLDFGAGMGRNSKYLKTIYKNYLAYDTPPMLKNLLKRQILNKNEFLFPLETIEKIKLDLVYESVVMQHMPPEEVIFILNRISYRSPYFFSWTRSYNDYLRDFKKQSHGLNMALLIKSTGLFEPVYSSIPIELASSVMDETEYKVLYRSKNYKYEIWN
jgi:hypothetical protein